MRGRRRRSERASSPRPSRGGGARRRGLPRADPPALAVRSSSLLEDSQPPAVHRRLRHVHAAQQPRAMDERLDQVLRAVKRVYASTFLRARQGLSAATSYRLEEEKMAVILQRIVGAVARPRASIPISPASPARTTSIPRRRWPPREGIAAVALGLGRASWKAAPACASARAIRSTSHSSPSVPDDARLHASATFWALSSTGDGLGLREESVRPGDRRSRWHARGRRPRLIRPTTTRSTTGSRAPGRASSRSRPSSSTASSLSPTC